MALESRRVGQRSFGKKGNFQHDLAIALHPYPHRDMVDDAARVCWLLVYLRLFTNFFHSQHVRPCFGEWVLAAALSAMLTWVLTYCSQSKWWCVIIASPVHMCIYPLPLSSGCSSGLFSSIHEGTVGLLCYVCRAVGHKLFRTFRAGMWLEPGISLKSCSNVSWSGDLAWCYRSRGVQEAGVPLV